MDMKFCQSCGMPLQSDEHFGTNADGSPNEEYCCYCYQKGAFTSDCTMDEMIGQCLTFLEEFNKDSEKPYSKEQAEAEMKQYFPTLKRWSAGK